MTNKDVKKNIKDLLEGIDEFDSKYITYSAEVHRKVLGEILDYIKRKEQECDKYKSALDEIEKIANKQRKFDLTGKTPLTPVINEVGGDFIDILDIIDKVQGK